LEEEAFLAQLREKRGRGKSTRPPSETAVLSSEEEVLREMPYTIGGSV